ncbi:MAG: hypothetical protein IPP40_13140 [bacterium]|nr:hypothetical protein [bacterium]
MIPLLPRRSSSHILPKIRDARVEEQQKAEAIPMYGMLTYKADAASYVDCRTLQMYAVPFKGDWLKVEHEYVNMRKHGEPLYRVSRTVNKPTDRRQHPPCCGD